MKPEIRKILELLREARQKAHENRSRTRNQMKRELIRLTHRISTIEDDFEEFADKWDPQEGDK